MHAALESREARGDSAAFVTRSRVVKARSLVAARADASRAPDASGTGARGRARRGAGRPARAAGLAGRDTGLGVARAGGGAFERAPHARVVVVSLRAAESRRGVVALLALVSVGPAPAGHLRTRAGWGEARRVASRGGSVAGGVRTRAARGNARAAKGGAVARARATRRKRWWGAAPPCRLRFPRPRRRSRSRRSSWARPRPGASRPPPSSPRRAGARG